MYYLAIERYVQLKFTILSFFMAENKIGVTFYFIDTASWLTRGADEYIYKFWRVTKYGGEIISWVAWLFNDALLESFLVFITGAIIGLVIFTYRGRNMLGAKKLRGSDIVPVAKLRSVLKKAKAASKIEISGLPLVKGSETQHLLLTGTTGAGKTNMLKELLP